MRESAHEKLEREKDRLTRMADVEKENMDTIIDAERSLLKGER